MRERQQREWMSGRASCFVAVHRPRLKVYTFTISEACAIWAMGHQCANGRLCNKLRKRLLGPVFVPKLTVCETTSHRCATVFVPGNEPPSRTRLLKTY